MPVIPRYFSEARVPIVQQPRVPENLGSAETEAMGQIGKTLFNEGLEADKKAESLKQIDDLGRFNTEADQRIFDYYQNKVNSPEHLADPEGSLANIREDFDAIRSDIEPRITDPRVKIHWRNSFNNTVMSYQKQLFTNAQHQREALSVAGISNTVAQQSKLVAESPTDDQALLALGRMKSSIYGIGMARGLDPAKMDEVFRRESSAAIKNRLVNLASVDPVLAQQKFIENGEIVKHMTGTDAREVNLFLQAKVEHAQNKAKVEANDLAKQAEAKLDNDIFNELQRSFKDNFALQERLIMNPDFHPEWTQDKRKSMASSVRDADSFRRQQQKVEKDASKNMVFRMAYTGKGLTDMDIESVSSDILDGEDIRKLKDYNKTKTTDKFATNPETRKQLISDIWSDKIKSERQILDRFEQGGISPEHLKDALATWKEKNDPLTASEMKSISDLYESTYPKNTSYPGKNEFMYIMDLNIRKAKESGKSLSGDDLHKLAKRQLEVVEQIEMGKLWNSVVARKPRFAFGYEDLFPVKDEVDQVVNTQPKEAQPFMPEGTTGDKIQKPIPTPDPEGQKIIDSLYQQGKTTDEIKALMEKSKKNKYDFNRYQFRD